MSNLESSAAADEIPTHSLRWWALGLSKSFLALVLVYAPIAWFTTHYRVAIDATKGARCLPYSVFLVDVKDRTVQRGDYVAFFSQQMEPFYRDGTLAVKKLAATSGDAVKVNERGVWANGQYWGELKHVLPGERLWRMGRRIAQYQREERVPEHRLWVLGTEPRSYDSRYWGYISDEQVVGRAIPLW